MKLIKNLWLCFMHGFLELARALPCWRKVYVAYTMKKMTRRITVIGKGLNDGRSCHIDKISVICGFSHAAKSCFKHCTITVIIFLAHSASVDNFSHQMGGRENKIVLACMLSINMQSTKAYSSLSAFCVCPFIDNELRATVTHRYPTKST